MTNIVNHQENHIDVPSRGKRFKRISIIAGVVVVFLAAVYFIFGRTLKEYYYHWRLKKLNVILITLDTLRADYVGCYKHGNALTPHIDAVANEGVIFERCIAQAPLTLPSHTSILSGTYPLYHGVRTNGGFRIPTEIEFISEVLKKENFKTSGFIGSYVLHSKWGVNQGFDFFSDDFDLKKFYTTTSEIEKNAETVLKDARVWLKKQVETGGRFFTWIHLFDPHRPYKAPGLYGDKYPDNPYRGEVEYVDEQLGLFFDFLKEEGIYNDTLLIITADHGEGLWEHGERTHGLFIYQSTVHVPLIIRAPFSLPVQRVSGLVELVDIAPTVLQALGIDIPASFQGESFLGLMLGQDTRSKQMAYTESFYSRLHRGWSQLQGIYRDEWKYIWAPNDELYQIIQDPNEQENLSIKKSFEKKKMKERLEHFISRMSNNALAPKTLEKSNKDDMKMLESLGYLTTFTDSHEKQALPDPKDKIHLLQDYEQVSIFISEGKYDEAISLAKRVINQDPASIEGYMKLASAYQQKNKLEEAVVCYLEVLKRKPDYNTAQINLLQLLISMQCFDEAVAEAEKFLKLFPNDFSIINELGSAYFFKGDLERALELFQQSVKIEPANSEAFLRMGEIYLKRQDYEQAESFFNQALAIYNRLENVHSGLAQVYEAQGNLPRAVEFYKRELELNDQNLFATFRLAENLKKRGDYTGALLYYKRAIEINPNFKLPYFMIARYYMEKGQRLEEAIELCLKGTGIEPVDETTLYGYYILTNIYAKLGDQEKFKYYSQAGESLLKRLGKQTPLELK